MQSLLFSFLLSHATGHLSRLTRMTSSTSFGIKTLMLMLCFTTFACQPKTISFNSFNSEQWISETAECKDYRKSVIDEMEAEFDQFIGMSETELITYLGTPNKTLLYTRGQKFFTYAIDCNDSLDNSRILRIRFSALDYVNELIILD